MAADKLILKFDKEVDFLYIILQGKAELKTVLINS